MSVKILCEIGINHNGDMNVVRKLIDVCSVAGVDYVKFQKRNLEILSSIPEYQLPHPNPENAFGETYFLHRKALEFSLEQHKQLKQ